MGILKYGLAVALGYALGRPDGRERLGQVGRQAAELGKRPEVAQLRERGRSAATDGVEAVKQKVATKRPFSRSRDAHFPASEGVTAPASLGGTTVMEDSEAAVLGRPATPHGEPSASADRPV